MTAPNSPRPPVQPLSLDDIDELQALLDRVPAPLEPLDVSMLDGFLCGVLVQPQRVPESRWLPHVTDADGRALPARFDAARLHTLARRRHAELDDAIARRQWFDPWVFELEDEESPARRQDDDSDEPPPIDAVLPWVAGFATAQEFFPALMQQDAQALTEPLALLYRHLDPDDLEDADELLEEIESLEPPVDLAEAVEGLVRATLLLADVSRPVQSSPRPSSSSPRRRGPTRGTR
jgi:uncharacterized protein